METAYVGNSVSAENASTTVGTEVIKAVAQKYQTNNQIGKANIEIEDFGTIENVTGDATVTVSTTDFEIEGTITLNDGILTWNEIVPNTPRIKLNRKDIALAPGGTATLSVKFKQLEETNIEWTTSNANVATVLNGVVTIKTTANDDDTAIITAKATYGDKNYTATCNVLVAQVSIPATQALINTPTMIGADVLNYTANDVEEWQVFYATENEVFIISKNILELCTKIDGKNSNYLGSESFNTPFTEGQDLTYGNTWNSKWLTACTSANTNVNAKTAAYLCDSKQWEIYKTGPANYAVGGPTIELLAKSIDIKENRTIFDSISSNKEGYNKSSVSFDEPYKAKYDTTNYGQYWLASPSEGDAKSFLRTITSGGIMDASEYNAKGTIFGIRPLVSIPMNKVKIVGNKVKID